MVLLGFAVAKLRQDLVHTPLLRAAVVESDISGFVADADNRGGKRRVLVIEQATGTYEYANVSPEIWRRFSTASSLSSFFRDNIDEEFNKRRIK